jgi:hypothetical protein
LTRTASPRCKSNIVLRVEQAMSRQALNDNTWLLPTASKGHSRHGNLTVIGTAALLRALPKVRSERERFLAVLRSRSFLTHADAIEALWGESEDGGPSQTPSARSRPIDRGGGSRSDCGDGGIAEII